MMNRDNYTRPLRTRERIANRREYVCQNPWSYVWCQGKITRGRHYVAVLADGPLGTTELVAILCPSCADHPQTQLWTTR